MNMTQNHIDNGNANNGTQAHTLATVAVTAETLAAIGGQPQPQGQTQGGPTLILLPTKPRQVNMGTSPAIAGLSAATVLPEYADHHTARALFGLSRSYLYTLAAEGVIRTVNVVRPGASKGRRLFECASIRALMQASAMNTAPPSAAELAESESEAEAA